MATIENYANLPSAADYQEILRKFPAFASAALSQKAKKEEAYESSQYKTGWYFTRTAVAGSSGIVEFVGFDGYMYDDLSDDITVGLPHCVKDCRNLG